MMMTGAVCAMVARRAGHRGLRYGHNPIRIEIACSRRRFEMRNARHVTDLPVWFAVNW